MGDYNLERWYRHVRRPRSLPSLQTLVYRQRTLDIKIFLVLGYPWLLSNSSINPAIQKWLTYIFACDHHRVIDGRTYTYIYYQLCEETEVDAGTLAEQDIKCPFEAATEGAKSHSHLPSQPPASTGKLWPRQLPEKRKTVLLLLANLNSRSVYSPTLSLNLEPRLLRPGAHLAPLIQLQLAAVSRRKCTTWSDKQESCLGLRNIPQYGEKTRKL